MRILLLNIFLFFSIKVFAIELIFPLKCSLGENCHIQYYYNHASGSDLQDYSCGSMTIPKVKGTSIRLSDTNELVKGYEIIAAAKGKITSVTSNIPDKILTEEIKKQLQNQTCGNNVIIDHGEGWKTQYCHMMKDSIIVAPGDSVKGGAPLGLMGLSGLTSYPHLEFILTKNKKFIDPYDYSGNEGKCSEKPNSLWKNNSLLSYPDSTIISSSFTNTLPNLQEVVLAGHHPIVLHHTIKKLTFWLQIIGAKKGDIHSIFIFNHKGDIIAKSPNNVLTNDQQVGITSLVHEVGTGSFTPGLYKGFFVVERVIDGQKKIIREHNNQIVLQ